MYTTDMNFKKYSGRMYCFSPPVMLATFIFEFCAAAYVIWRYKMTTTTRLITGMLVALGTFQLAEYMICGGLGMNGEQWARLGYVSITLLPALGIHLIASLAGKQSKALLYTAYTSMLAFSAYFAFTPGLLNIHECRPNYAVFDLDQVSTTIYGLYYYGWLVTGVVLAYRWSRDQKVARPLLYMCVGYLLFMVPTTTVNLIDPSTTAGIPSIMCGFAVLLAIDFIFFVLPSSKAAERITTKGASKKTA